MKKQAKFHRRLLGVLSTAFMGMGCNASYAPYTLKRDLVKLPQILEHAGAQASMVEIQPYPLATLLPSLV